MPAWESMPTARFLALAAWSAWGGKGSGESWNCSKRLRSQTSVARGEQLFQEAETWIEDPDRTWLFSFQNICDVLDIDADYLRRGLRALKQRVRSGGHRGQVVSLRPGDDELRKASGD